MSEQTMIECMCRAICDVIGHNPDKLAEGKQEDPSKPPLAVPYWALYVEVVLHQLKMMKQLTPIMQEAGDTVTGNSVITKHTWDTMIDTAMKEKIV